MLHQPVLDYPAHLLLKLRLGVLSQLLKVAALTSGPCREICKERLRAYFEGLVFNKRESTVTFEKIELPPLSFDSGS